MSESRPAYGLLILVSILHATWAERLRLNCAENCLVNPSVRVNKVWKHVSCYDSEALCKRSGAYHTNAVCETGGPLSFQNIFHIDSVNRIVTSAGYFLNISWTLPGFGVPKYSGSLPFAWILHLTVTSVEGPETVCYTFHFDSDSLQGVHGHFSVPCIDVSALSSPLKVSSMYYHHKINFEGNLSWPMFGQEFEMYLPGTYSAPAILPWFCNVKCTVSDNQLIVTFTPLQNPSLYTVVIRDTWENGSCKLSADGTVITKHINATSFQTAVEVDLHELESCRTYCVQVAVSENSLQQNCDSGCLSKLVDTVFIRTPPVLETNSVAHCVCGMCNRWNAIMTVQRKGNDITVHFAGCCESEQCFDTFDMFLCKLSTDECNGPHLTVDRIRFAKRGKNGTSLSFRNVSSGNYCLKVRPFCGSLTRTCVVRNSVLVSIPEEIVTEKVEFSTTREHTVSVSAAVTCSIAVVLIIAGLVFWRFKRRPFTFLEPIVALEDESPSDEALPSFSSITYFVLHTFDQGTKRKVKDLVHELREHAARSSIQIHFELAEEELHLIIRDRYSWIKPRINIKRSGDSGNMKRRIIVVESKRAVIHQMTRNKMQVHDGVQGTLDDKNKSGNLANGDIPDDELVEEGIDTQLDELFVYGLAYLTSLDMNTLDDYENVIVVHFGSTPAEFELQGLPRERYYLPQNMKQLVQKLIPRFSEEVAV